MTVHTTPEQATYPGYWAFYDEVALRQVRAWLADGPPGTLLDLSGPDRRYAALAEAAGYTVVVGDAYDLDGVAEVDAVLAEAGALSAHLAAEETFVRIHRVLRPGGRLLMCVESLVLGLARLADQGRWAELADAPSADVVLVPNEDGTITRCFWPDELTAVLDQFGYDVEWVRSRTVLSREAVAKALATDPNALATLVETELGLAREREGESTGIHLVVSAIRRG